MFEKKTVLINGGASGIGFLTAKRFAEKGATVVIADIKVDEAIKKEAEEKKWSIHMFKADCRSYEEVKEATKFALGFSGRIDILINSAGGSSSRVFGKSEAFKDLDIEIIDWGIDVNLKGVIYYCHSVIGNMMDQKDGVIINIGSVEGTTGTRAIDYGTAKSAIIGLTKSLAIYGAASGVRVCAVSPGPVLTRPEMARMQTLLGRAAEPEEITDLIEYLCTEKASFITGVNYLIDGGRSCGTISYAPQ